MELKRGDWIQTFTGKRVYPFDMTLSDIDIFDIAHALSNLCRFTGHTNRFYSVAQHSVIMSDICYHTYGKECAKVALLHDASEAYFGDMSRPIKRSLNDDNVILTANDVLQEMIYSKFGIYTSSHTWENPVRKTDNILLYTEGRDLMGGTDGWHDALHIVPLKKIIHPAYPKVAFNMFIKRFNKYGYYGRTS